MSVYGDVCINSRGASEGDDLHPKSCYGISKLTSEKYLSVFKEGLPYISMRMFNVYGPGQDMINLKQGMVSIYLSQAINSEKIIVKGSLERFRDFIYIDDVVKSWFRAATYDIELNQSINIGSGQKTTVSKLLGKISKLTKNSNYQLEGETPCDQLGIYSNPAKFKDLLGFVKLTSLDDGLKEFFAWAKSQ